MNDALMPRETAQEPLPRKDYTLELLRRASLQGTIPQERLEEIRLALHRAAAERAAAYTAGKSTTVTRKQAEAFYASVLCQLDTLLLLQENDARAEELLRTMPPDELMEKGQLWTLRLYEAAKENFRTAYKLTKPVMTSFFSTLLPQFAAFCTDYDARFRAYDTKVTLSYPLLGGTKITAGGVYGVSRYYAALRREGELLALFDADEIRTLETQYAALYRTEPEMIAENIAELVLRHALICALGGSDGLLPDAADIAAVSEKYAALSAETLAQDAADAAKTIIGGENVPVKVYVQEALPALAAELHSRILAGRLSGWLTAD